MVDRYGKINNNLKNEFYGTEQKIRLISEKSLDITTKTEPTSKNGTSKKKLLFAFLVTLLCVSYLKAQEPEENSQWIFFKETIPKHKSITISGDNWEMTINDKYKVSFTGSYSSSDSQYDEMYNSSYSESATFKGVGFVLWNGDLRGII